MNKEKRKTEKSSKKGTLDSDTQRITNEQENNKRKNRRAIRKKKKTAA